MLLMVSYRLDKVMGVFHVNFATDIQLIPVRKIGLIIHGFSHVFFATDIQSITVRKIITFMTESSFPEAYCHHKCPMGYITKPKVSQIL